MSEQHTFIYKGRLVRLCYHTTFQPAGVSRREWRRLTSGQDPYAFVQEGVSWLLLNLICKLLSLFVGPARAFVSLQLLMTLLHKTLTQS